MSRRPCQEYERSRDGANCAFCGLPLGKHSFSARTIPDMPKSIKAKSERLKVRRDKKYAIDLAEGRAAIGDLIRSASTLFDLADKYGDSIWSEIGRGRIDALKTLMSRALKLQMESLEGMSRWGTILPLSQSVAPSPGACSFYCAPSRGEPRGCVYCGHPKSKHTKTAQNKQKEYAPKGRAHV